MNDAVPSDTISSDPIARFSAWLEQAWHDDPLANAVALATADENGAPNVRMVLLKGHDARGFVFYTNLGSVKARELGVNPRASLCFHWKTQRRQVRVTGGVVQVDEIESDAYFASRPRDSQLAAWASRQSAPMAGREALEAALAEVTARFEGASVPRPTFWGGFRVDPERIEFWEDVPFRLHRRWVYVASAGGWSMHEVQP